MAAKVPGVFEESLRLKICESKILVVGAGGIGCEILKNLVLSGFPDIEIIDLDTIDVSNLNRQFLFHKEHVGKSKAEVARQSALKFNPDINIKAYHDSITTINYGVSFFQRFNLVLNALDNRQARNHVNRMCLTANIPLIESGTSGYNGQVELIKKDLTQCYECTPKQREKTYPNCTIRNTPSELIHCIVWAKHLFNQLFGEVIEDEDVSPDFTDPEAVGDTGLKALENKATDAGNIQRASTRQWAEQIQYDAEKLFNKLFYDDIKYLLSMEDLWKKRTPPKPLKWQDSVDFDNIEECIKSDSRVVSDQKIWTLSECVRAFTSSVMVLKNELSKLTKGNHLVWDKDDRNAMDFVSACANIRANIFKIPQKSRFEIKSMAGNIIPAIATTNAITAGIVIIHAFKVLQGQFDKCKSVYMRLRPNARNQLFVSDKILNPPNLKCFVCSLKHEVVLKVDTTKMTLKEFRENVLIKSLNMISPDVIMASKSCIIVSSEEDEIDLNNDKFLNEVDIVDGVILDADDYLQQYNLKIIIIHKDVKRDEPLFEIIADFENLKPQENSKIEVTGNGVEKLDTGDTIIETVPGNNDKDKKLKKYQKIDKNNDGDDDDVCIIEEYSITKNNSEIPNTSGTGMKRKNDPGEGPSTSKRAKVSISNDEDDDDLIILEDD